MRDNVMGLAGERTEYAELWKIENAPYDVSREPDEDCNPGDLREFLMKERDIQVLVRG